MLKRWPLAALALLCLPVQAEDVLVSWQNATQNTDGTPIAATGPSALASTIVEYGTCNGSAFGTKEGEITAAMPASSITVALVVAQEYCLQAKHRTNDGTESGPSNVAMHEITAPPVPNPPEDLTVDPGNLTAYEIILSDDNIALLPVGSVPAGTACDGEDSVNGRYRVPASAFVPPQGSDLEPLVIVANCLPN